MIRRLSRRRWLLAVAAVVAILAAACLGVGFMIPPAANTDQLPQSITVDGVVHERVRLVTLTTTPRREIMTVLLPTTSRSIVVRASCRLAVLHTGSTMAALMVETYWMRTGGNAADLPNTEGNENLRCHPGWGNNRLVQTIDPTWLPREDDHLRLTWYEQDTSADTPSNSPASWALAVYAS
jgi:hypothetical protein